MNSTPVIMDLDTGVDDILALMLAASSDRVDIKAITTCFGSGSLDQVTLNTLKALELLGLSDIPVAQGARKGIMSSLKTSARGRALLAPDGLGGVAGKLPFPKKTPEPVGACQLMAQVVEQSDGGVIIVCCGPLTNVATFILAHPDLLPRIQGIAVTGGAIFGGDLLPTVEFNIASDPEAAEIVINSGLKVFLCGLDATNKAVATFEDRERFRLAGGRVAELLYEPLKKLGEYSEQTMHRDGFPIADAATVAWLLNPEIFEVKPYYVEVDLGGRYTRGCTVTDVNGINGYQPNVVMATGINREAYIKMITDAFKVFKSREQ